MGSVGIKLGRGSVLGVGLAMWATLMPYSALAQGAPPAAPIDPYAPPAAQPAPPAPAPAPPPSSGPTINNSNNNTNTVSPVITANPTNNNSNTSTNNNTNTNDNKSSASATATNNNTIYIYPPAYPPPAPPPVVAPPTALTPPQLLPPPLVPPPVYGRGVYPQPPYYQQPRIRLNCGQLCGNIPRPIPIASPLRERIRYLAIGAHVTALGMAHQPLAGWGTLYGGGFHVTVRSRGRFGFEMAQDFLRGELRASDGGNSILRQTFPIDFTFRGYLLPNLDKHHFNMYFGAGFGAMASAVNVGGPFGESTQSFLEWTIHADVGAELRFKWIALGLDGKVMGIARDKNFGDGAYYGDVSNGVVPAKTWGLQGRGYLSAWF